jgi:adenosylhomocysteine nucleosidase
MTAQAALDRFNARGILFSGIAGGVNPDLSIGDVTVPAQWGEYQEQMAARQAGENWDTGSYARDFGNFGMMFPQKVAVTRKGARVDAQEQRFWFPADPGMLAAAKDVAGQVKLGKCTLLNVCLQSDPRVVTGGNGVSGPTFVDNAEYRQWVWQTFHADALDMESAAVAHVAFTNGTPFIAFRSLSDLAGGGPGQNEMLTFFQLAADNSARVVVKFLEIYKP